jgi:hypothetical protein
MANEKEYSAKARPVPIPPQSVVRLAYTDRGAGSLRKHLGDVFRVGYYSYQDGLDCVWLVNSEGKYEQTVSHGFLYKYFDVIQFAKDANWYGRARPHLPPVRRADGRKASRKWKPKNVPGNWEGRWPRRDTKK